MSPFFAVTGAATRHASRRWCGFAPLVWSVYLLRTACANVVWCGPSCTATQDSTWRMVGRQVRYKARFWEAVRYKIYSGIILNRHGISLEVLLNMWSTAKAGHWPLSIMHGMSLEEMDFHCPPGKFALHVTEVLTGALPASELYEAAHTMLADPQLIDDAFCSGWPIFYILLIVAHARSDREEDLMHEQTEQTQHLMDRFFRSAVTLRDQLISATGSTVASAFEACSKIASFNDCLVASSPLLDAAHVLQSVRVFGHHVCPRGTFAAHFDLMGPQPFQLCIEAKYDLMAEHLKNFGVWPECAKLATLLGDISLHHPHTHMRPGCKILDIGANIGSCTLTFATTGYRVAAFEPLPRNVDMLEASLRLNDFTVKRWGLDAFSSASSVVVFPGALGATRGNGSLAYETTNSGSPEVFPEGAAVCDGRPNNDWVCQQESVQVETLDHLLGMWNYPIEPFCFAKMDAQGSEVNILRGARESLRSQKILALTFEWRPQGFSHHGHKDPLLPLRMLHDSNYRIYGPVEWFAYSWPTDNWGETDWIEFGPNQFDDILQHRGDILAIARR